VITFPVWGFGAPDGAPDPQKPTSTLTIKRCLSQFILYIHVNQKLKIMIVQELINYLKQFDPETEVFTSITDHTDYTVTLSLDTNDIELEDELSGDNVIDDYESQFDDEGDYIGKPVLVIKLEN